MPVVGPLTVTAPPKRVAWVRSTLALFDEDVAPALFIPRGCSVIFGNVKRIPGTNDRAVGYTLSATRTKVRHGMVDAPNLSKEVTEYTVAHEAIVGHARLAQRPLTDDQKRRCIALVTLGVPVPAFTDPDEVWRKVEDEEDYWLRIYEVIIDAAVEACTAIESPYKFDPARPNRRGHYRRGISDADLSELRTIWLEGLQDAPPPVQPEPEEPLPPPDDPCQSLRDELADRESRLALARQKGAELVEI